MAVGAERLDIGSRDHVVQFYADDWELIDRVGDYLLSALKDGDVVIVIATPEHRCAFARRLTEAGVDVVAAREEGTYLAVDARETVSQFTVDGKPDAARFERVIGNLVRTMVDSGRPVRAYGEMVALLWNDGLVNAAIDLEVLWNELGSQYPFSLFCAYPAHSVAKDAEVDAVNEVCLLHGGVVGAVPDVNGSKPIAQPAARSAGPTAESKLFSLSSDGPAEARHFAVVATSRLGAEHLADDVALIVTELAANAVLHARSDFSLTLSAGPDFVRISVRDKRPVPEGESLSAEPMHGLGLVATLARNWGVLSLDDGKLIWAELPALGVLRGAGLIRVGCVGSSGGGACAGGACGGGACGAGGCADGASAQRYPGHGQHESHRERDETHDLRGHDRHAEREQRDARISLRVAGAAARSRCWAGGVGWADLREQARCVARPDERAGLVVQSRKRADPDTGAAAESVAPAGAVAHS
ncbi:MAG TPA: MEDS domain-containing protein [Streptosporangiaceae bacterium]